MSVAADAYCDMDGVEEVSSALEEDDDEDADNKDDEVRLETLATDTLDSTADTWLTICASDVADAAAAATG